MLEKSLAFEQFKAFKAQNPIYLAPTPKPEGYKVPPLKHPDFNMGLVNGWISEAEQIQAEHDYYARRNRAYASVVNHTPVPRRFVNDPPEPSKQFTQPMATECNRDARLSNGAKMLMVQLVALAGKNPFINTNKNSLAQVLNRSARTIQRYLSELEHFDYIKRLVRISKNTHMDIGLKVFITQKLRPYFKKKVDIAGEILKAEYVRYIEKSVISAKTFLSHINNLNINNINKVSNSQFSSEFETEKIFI